MTELHGIPKLAFKNRIAIEQSETCGCYSCATTFSKHDITEWTDWGQTALCPHCQTDSVLPQTAGVLLNKETLERIGKYWFGRL